MGDANPNKWQYLFYPILRVLRDEVERNSEFVLDRDVVLIVNDSSEIRIPVVEFKKQAKYLF